MKKLLKSVLLVVAGVVVGIAVSQALLVSASRQDGIAGSEVVIPLAFPLLLGIGWWVGRDTPRVEDYESGRKEGYRQGAADQARLMMTPRHPNCRHVFNPYDYEKEADETERGYMR